VSLLALLLLTGLVWWRVLHRGGASASSGKPCPTPTASTPATSQSLPAPAQVTVQVLNSTNRSGIAAKARTTLTGYGFLSPKAATNDSPHKHVPGVAEIRFGPSGAKAAKLLSFYFPGAKLVPNSAKSPVVIVSLGERYKRVAAAGAVSAALKKQHFVTASAQPQPAPSASRSC
jgi:hypothetical protein